MTDLEIEQHVKTLILTEGWKPVIAALKKFAKGREVQLNGCGAFTAGAQWNKIHDKLDSIPKYPTL